MWLFFKACWNYWTPTFFVISNKSVNKQLEAWLPLQRKKVYIHDNWLPCGSKWGLSTHTHTHTHTHTSKTAGTNRHVRTESAVAPLPPRPAFRLGLCMSNATKLAIAVQHTTETSNRPLRMLEIVQAALKQRVKKKWAAIITNPNQTLLFGFRQKFFRSDRMKRAIAADLKCFLGL